MNTILVTGSPGFIGANLVIKLLQTLESGLIVSLDNLNDYYDPELKLYRLNRINEVTAASPVQHIFIKGDIADKDLISSLFQQYHFDIVVNLAAQAGVRYSIDHPDVYINSNILGFYNILEACRHSYDFADSADSLTSDDSDTAEGYSGVQHLVYASSSSVYGGNSKLPYSTEDKTDSPVSLYAATKKSNELLAHAYAKLYDIPCTGLRFFTVYGPGGRPDMAYFSFTDKLYHNGTIRLFNYGNCERDFTYVDDIVQSVRRVMGGAPERAIGADGLPVPPHAVYNIGNSHPVNLLDFVTILQEELVRADVLPADYDFEAHRELVPMQPGDVLATYADTAPLERDFGFRPSTDLRTGLRQFARWYRSYYIG